MNNTKPIAFLLLFSLLASSALAETEPAAGNTAASDRITNARSRYLKAGVGSQIDYDADPRANTLAQITRRGPGTPRAPRYPQRPSYPSPRVDQGGGQALAGAAIGFGVGAVFGAIGGVRNHTPVAAGVVLGGSICGLIGFIVGAAHAASLSLVHRPTLDPPAAPEDDEAGDQTGSARRIDHLQSASGN